MRLQNFVSSVLPNLAQGKQHDDYLLQPYTGWPDMTEVSVTPAASV